MNMLRTADIPGLLLALGAALLTTVIVRIWAAAEPVSADIGGSPLAAHPGKQSGAQGLGTLPA
jgi:hypothetical protein